MNISDDDTIEVLGVHWDLATDNFGFRFQLKLTTSAVTKQILAFKIATMFDPLGWFSPITMAAKLIIQEILKARIGMNNLR